MINPSAQFQKANDARRKSDLAQLQKVLENYYSDKGRYPYSTGRDGFWAQGSCIALGEPGPPRAYRIAAALDISGNATDCVGWGTTWTAYETKIPKDPVSSNKYTYSVSSDGQIYYLYAHLERGYRDKQNCCPAASQVDGCTCLHTTGSDESAGDTVDQWVCAANGQWFNHLNSEVCNYGVSSSNTRP
ncbi:MAG: hypothetical protein AAB521_02600 [Patescibacteria group bacterium]